jgi:hypothetical protein
MVFGLPFGVRHDPLKDLCNLIGVHFERGLLEDLPADSCVQSLSDLDDAAGQ